jgi:hypothetical protein
VESKQLSGRQPVIKAEMFGKESNLAPSGDLSGGPPQNARVALGGSSQAQQHSHRRRLACAIGTEEAKHFTARDLKRKTAHGRPLAIDLAKPLRLDGGAVNRLQ